MTLRRIVIVGNGIAGLTAADTLRAEGFDGVIAIIGDETAYSRPALSKALLRDRDDVTSHELPPASHGAEERIGVRATRLDPGRRIVWTSDGDGVPYDGLVIATGCRSRRLGARDSGELTLRTLQDALSLRDRVAEQPTVMVVGGGPLGMEIASGCLAAGCEVTLASVGAPLHAQLGEHLSALCVTAARSLGLRLVTTDGACVRRSHDGTVVELGERTVEADLVVSAVGDIPNTDWLASSGLLRQGRLEVDDRGRVRADIVAAGDVAMLPTPTGLRRLPMWHSAIEQGQASARALLHGDGAAALNHTPYFWTEQFGLSIKAIGQLPFGGVPEQIGGEDEAALLRWSDPEGAAVAAVNYRIPIPRLRRLREAAA